jgi:FkbM family methyltransferase
MTTSELGHSKNWAEAGSNFLNADEEVLPFWAPAIVLADVLEREKVGRIDFLSIDVEGAELNVLKGIDFSKCEIDLILIETESDSESISFLKKEGFEHIVDLGINHFFKKIASHQ